MRLAFAPSPWLAPRTQPWVAGWRFARELPAAGRCARALQWRFARGGAFAPRQRGATLALLGAVSVGITIGLGLAGAPSVLPFAALQLALLAAAWLLWSRHGDDAETITLAARELSVEHRCGRRTERVAFRAEWVRVEPAHGARSLLELSGQGRRTRVGRYLRPEWRAALARELREAVKHECLRGAPREQPQEEPR